MLSPMLFNQCAIATFDRVDGVYVDVAISRCNEQAHHLLNTKSNDLFTVY